MFQRKNLKKLEEELYVRSKLNDLVFLPFFLLLSLFSVAENYYELDSNLAVVQRLNYNLELASANDLLNEYELSHPDNSAIHYLFHFNAFLKAFISEEEQYYANYRKVKDRALRHYEKLPDCSRYKRFLQSEVYFHSAAVKAKHNELYSAALDVSRVLYLTDKNHELFPTFLPNNKLRGLIKVYLSTVPDNYKWAVKLLGAEGNISEGLKLLKELAKQQNVESEINGIAKEAGYLYAFALHQVAKRPREAWVQVFQYTKDYETNVLSAFFRANLAMKLNKNLTALSVISSIEKKEVRNNFLFLDYMYGILKMNQQNEDAIIYLKNYTNKFKGRSFKQSCLQKISWYYVLQGDLENASNSQLAILDLPESMMEADKQALEYAHKSLPLKNLLEIRMLCDQGEYKQAKVRLSAIDHRQLPSRGYKIEYSYRYGQVSEKLGNMSAAEKFYKACILLAKDSKEYYGAYASIYLGDYYLSLQDKDRAIEHYQQALSFKRNREYTESIEHRATIGIERAGRITKE